MRRKANFLRVFPLALVLLASAAITGCSASARVRVSDPNHDVNHFNFNSGADRDRQQYAPRDGRDYLSPQNLCRNLPDVWK
jgi:hypothetical protein